jgi:hypothetical protein
MTATSATSQASFDALMKAYVMPNGELNISAVNAAMTKFKSFEVAADWIRFDNVVFSHTERTVARSVPANCIVVSFKANKGFEEYRSKLMLEQEKIQSARKLKADAIQGIASADAKIAAAKDEKAAAAKEKAAAAKEKAAAKDEKAAAAKEKAEAQQRLAEKMAKLELLRKNNAAVNASAKSGSPKQAVSVSAAYVPVPQKAALQDNKAGSPPKPSAAVTSIPAGLSGKPSVAPRPAVSGAAKAQF